MQTDRQSVIGALASHLLRIIPDGEQLRVYSIATDSYLWAGLENGRLIWAEAPTAEGRQTELGMLRKRASDVAAERLGYEPFEYAERN
jgi:hypothetical protein